MRGTSGRSGRPSTNKASCFLAMLHVFALYLLIVGWYVWWVMIYLERNNGVVRVNYSGFTGERPGICQDTGDRVSRSSGSAHHIIRVVNTGSKWPPTPTRAVVGHTKQQKREEEVGFQNSTSEI